MKLIRGREPTKGLVFLTVIINCLIAINLNNFAQDSEIENNQVMLNQILEKAGNYCEKVKKLALFYVCKEKITEKKYLYKVENVKKKIPDSDTEAWFKRLKVRGTEKKTYIYDYQLIKKKGKLKEKRILLEENGKKKHEENAELKVFKYKGKYLIFGPVGFLSKYWQDYFDYELVGRDTLNSKEAIIIRSSPKSAMEENNNYGRIWVDKEDFSILKIEWDPRSIKNYEEEQIPSPIGDLKKEMIWSVSYAIEKKGVRFPSEQLIQEVFVNKEGEKITQREILFVYDDYKFFIVEVDIRY